jgi:hypothetical protein
VMSAPSKECFRKGSSFGSRKTAVSMWPRDAAAADTRLIAASLCC